MSKTRAIAFVGRYGTLIVLALMVIVLSIVAPNSFAQPSNFMNIINQVSITAIIACGMTFVLVVGEFDLSVGYLASFAGVLSVGLIVNQEFGVLPAVVATVLIGGIFGMINGFIVTRLGVNALITTLGTGTVIVGLNYMYSDGIPISGLAEYPAFTNIAQGRVLGIPLTVWYMIIVVAVLWLVLNRTVSGQQMQAVGGNERAAALSGVKVERIKVLAFVIAGLCAALAGVLLASRIGSGQVTAGDGYLMQSFAAVFLGSAALRDGEFHILGTVIGVVTVGVGFNGIAILGAPTYVQFIFQGTLLVAAVALSTTARKVALNAKA